MESGRIAESAQLLDDPLFDGWFVLGPRAGELAADLDTLDGEPSVPPGGAAMERFLERYCRERLTSELERIVRRLFLAAELMQQEGRERREIEIVLAAALGLSRGVMPSHRHPLLRRWLMELIDLVREAKGEGYAFPLAAGDDEWD